MKNKSVIYFAGDFVSDNGPAVVNRNYLHHLHDDILASTDNKKLRRMLHFISRFMGIKIILVSSLSRFHLFQIVLGNIFRKETFYLMHGYTKFESEMNHDYGSINNIRLERRILNSVGTIICVSKLFSEYLKKELPECAHKIVYVNNGANFIVQKDDLGKTHGNKKKVNILSFGGGLPIKNNIAVCRALDELDMENISYLVVGSVGQDGSAISRYPFVTLIESVNRSQALKYMASADLYIQNSVFETFCLSACEAVGLNKKVLLSRNTGALDSLTGLRSMNIIDDTHDIDEIKKKVSKIVRMDQAASVSIKGDCDWSTSACKLLKVLTEGER